MVKKIMGGLPVINAIVRQVAHVMGLIPKIMKAKVAKAAETTNTN